MPFSLLDPSLWDGFSCHVMSVVQSLTQIQLCNPMDCSTPVFPVPHHLLELAQTRVHWVSFAIQPSHPLSSPSPPALNLSQHQSLFWWSGSLHQMAKVLELQHQSFNEYSGLISFRIYWFDLIVQGTLKSLLQHHSLKASILQHFNLFYGLTFTSMHDYWENHRFAYMNLCQKSDVSAFQFAL